MSNEAAGELMLWIIEREQMNEGRQLLRSALAAERKAVVERLPRSKMGPPTAVMVDALIAVRLGPKMTVNDVQDAVNAYPGLLFLDGRRMFDDEMTP